MVDERLPPSPVTERRRRRGPRSLQAIARRLRTTDDRRQPPSGSPGKSGHVPLEIDTKVTILSLNIRGFRSYQIDFETFEHIPLSGYILVSRLERRDGFAKSGGILLSVLEK